MRFYFVENAIGPRRHPILHNVILVRTDVVLIGWTELDAVGLFEFREDFICLFREKRTINDEPCSFAKTVLGREFQINFYPL